MSLKIASDFDFRTELLDANESYIRDNLNLEIENWVKFRHAIKRGTNADSLKSNAPIIDEVREAYIELGKANYEIILALGSLSLSLIKVKENEINLHLFLIKHVKEFYFHSGILLDNLGRLIFIINHPDSAKEMAGKLLKRHVIDWGKAKATTFPTFKNYEKFFNDLVIQEIINLRNNIAHNWTSIVLLDKDNIPHWPIEIRTTRNYYWHYEEKLKFDEIYKTRKSILQFLQDDFKYIELFQNDVYEQLIIDIKEFETANNLEIV